MLRTPRRSIRREGRAAPWRFVLVAQVEHRKRCLRSDLIVVLVAFIAANNGYCGC